MTIFQAEQAYLNDLRQLPDRLSKYQYVLSIAGLAEAFPDAEKTEANRIKSCQIKTWFCAHVSEGKLFFQSDSESLLIKGILNILTEIYSDHTPQEILSAQSALLQDPEIVSVIPENRSNGIQSVWRNIQAAARTCMEGR